MVIISISALRFVLSMSSSIVRVFPPTKKPCLSESGFLSSGWRWGLVGLRLLLRCRRLRLGDLFRIDVIAFNRCHYGQFDNDVTLAYPCNDVVVRQPLGVFAANGDDEIANAETRHLENNEMLSSGPKINCTTNINDVYLCNQLR